MKHLYPYLLVSFFLLPWALPAHAQTPLSLGSKAELVTKFKAQTANARAQNISQALPENETLALQINVSKKQGKADLFIGEVEGHKNATFFLKSSDEELSGYIILKDQKRAYEYFTEGGESVYLKEVDIDKVLCVDYGEAPQEGKDEKREGTSNRTMAVPMLESLPGASAVVLLDFDGQVVSGTLWNGGATINAAPAVFSDAVAIEIWKMMAEDFRPWDINITTNEAVFNAAPVGSRMRVIFTPTDDAYPNSGGVAYIGSFTFGDMSYGETPCWVFNSGIKGAGEAGSHEVGHTLGLRHDGRTAPYYEEYYAGNDDWAPIMGVGYVRNVVQWSKGEYPYASRDEDDLHIISTQNGFGYRTDDHDNEPAGATPLVADGSGTISASDNQGIIETQSDADVFSFTTGAGAISFDANPNPYYPNLDILLTLKDAAGNTLATADPSSLSASIHLSVAEGTYYLYVDGTQGSKGAQSDYSSLGEYTISGTIVIGTDVTPPVLAGVPDNTAASCENVPEPPTVTATDEVDGSVPVSYNQTIVPGSCAGNYTITRHWSATDAAGNSASATQTIAVTDNAGPVLSGVPTILTALAADGSCEAAVNFPDIAALDNCGSAGLTLSHASGSTFPLGMTEVRVHAEDECGNSTETSFHVEVINDAPIVSSLTAPLEAQLVNQVVTASASFTDNNLASASWDWGDGSPATAGTISGSNITGSHTYTEAGLYTLSLSLEDACGETASQTHQYVVIYDPSAGFVTGGGFTLSPPGAYVANPMAEGKISFGFVSKYNSHRSKQKSSDVLPGGNVNIEFKTANLGFESSAYEWLVITGNKAFCKGSGSLNGTNGYGFLLSAVDGNQKNSKGEDRLRIKIWDALGNTVYDNQMGADLDAEASTALSGGSIVIHTGKEKAKGKSTAFSSIRSADSSPDASSSFTNISAYPNPLQKEGLWLELPATEQTKDVQASIFDLKGRLITSSSFKLQEGGTNMQLWELDSSEWPSGIYLLLIRGDQIKEQLKLIKP